MDYGAPEDKERWDETYSDGRCIFKGRDILYFDKSEDGYTLAYSPNLKGKDVKEIYAKGRTRMTLKAHLGTRRNLSASVRKAPAALTHITISTSGS